MFLFCLLDDRIALSTSACFFLSTKTRYHYWNSSDLNWQDLAIVDMSRPILMERGWIGNLKASKILGR